MLGHPYTFKIRSVNACGYVKGKREKIPKDTEIGTKNIK